MAEAENSFIFYPSFYKAMKYLSDEDRLQAYDAICGYAVDGTEPEDISSTAMAIFCMAKPQIDANSSRRSNGKAGGRPPKEKPMVSENTETEKPMVSENTETEKPNVNVNANENVNVNDKEKEKKENRRFTPPSPSEVNEYSAQIGANVDGDTFCDFYASKGWMIGKDKMKDWKAAVRTWKKRGSGDTRAGTRASPNRFTAGVTKHIDNDIISRLEAQSYENHT